jgi:hypothetical protein
VARLAWRGIGGWPAVSIESCSEGPVEVKIEFSRCRVNVVETDAPADEIERQLAVRCPAITIPVRAGDEQGGKILVPADKIAYVEFGAPEARRISRQHRLTTGVLVVAGLPGGRDRLLVYWVTLVNGMT